MIVRSELPERKVTKLAEIDGRKSQVVELRFFGGLSVEESAEVLKVSAGTVLRDWPKSRLVRELSGEDCDQAGSNEV